MKKQYRCFRKPGILDGEKVVYSRLPILFHRFVRLNHLADIVSGNLPGNSHWMLRIENQQKILSTVV